MRRKVVALLQNFSQQTTVHGLPIICIHNLHVIERILWIFICTVAICGSIGISYSNWIRYSANPTVVSLQKDFRNWNNFFPAATGCFLEKANKAKTEKLILEKWGINSTHTQFSYYVKFVKTVANISYYNLNEFNKFANDSTLNKIDLFNIAKKVHPDLSGTLVTFDTKFKPNWTVIMTEMGTCFTVNAKFANFMDINYIHKNNHKLTFPKILKCHYLNGLCYARYDSDPQLPLLYYVHSHFDIIHATIDAPLKVHESEELEINYRMQETDSALGLRSLTPSQRGCRFFDEPIIKDIPFYSTSICYMICRYKLAMKLCSCRPFFYHNLGGKVCDLNGLICLSKFVENITKPPSEIGCECLQPCDSTIYYPQTPKLTKWENGYFDQRITFRWGLLPPTTKYHRDVLFGFDDLVGIYIFGCSILLPIKSSFTLQVSFGGTLALFLGFSFISAIESIFLFVENIVINW